MNKMINHFSILQQYSFCYKLFPRQKSFNNSTLDKFNKYDVPSQIKCCENGVKRCDTLMYMGESMPF